ncbi:MAG TPA: RHS repeat-associated core domain-containing protein, partial [Candidatus Didemnitutus sp.]
TLLGQVQTVTATYDAFGHQKQLADPDKGTWNYVNDALGRVLQQSDAKGTITNSTFDHLGRALTRVTTETAGPVETAGFYYYDSGGLGGKPNTVDKGAKGWIGAPERETVSVTGSPGYANPGSTTVHFYDALGRPDIELNGIDGKWFYTCTAYDVFSRPGRVQYYWRPGSDAEANNQINPNSTTWNSFGYFNAFDSQSYLTAVTDSDGRSWWGSPAYDQQDRITSVTKGGYATTRSYRDSDGVLLAINTSASGTQYQSLAYNFDGLGNLTSRSNGTATEGLGYDNLNRLTSSSITGGIAYLSNGNIQNKTAVDGTTTPNYTYDSTHPHAVASAFGCAIGYDANGNLNTRTKTGESWSFNWNGADKPRWMIRNSTAGLAGDEFLYNANRSRVIHLDVSAASGTAPSQVPTGYSYKKIYAAGASMEVEYNYASSSWHHVKARIYVPAPDGAAGAVEFTPAANNTVTEQADVYHYDHLGSIDCITTYVPPPPAAYATDHAGKTTRYSEDAWGQRRNPVSWSGAPTAATSTGGHTDLTMRGFTGHEMLDDIGLIHMDGRIYDPLLGRFLSADVFVEDTANLQAYNRYSYVRNNPLTLTDSTGFWTDQGLQKEMASTPEGQQLAADVATAAANGWTISAVDDIRDNGVIKNGAQGYTQKDAKDKQIFITRDADEPDYAAMKTLAHELKGHAAEFDKTGDTKTTLKEEVNARVIGDDMMIKTKHLDAVNPKDLDKNGKPSPEQIKNQLLQPAMKKAYNMVPKNTPPPPPHVITVDKATPILVPKPKPPAPAPAPAPSPVPPKQQPPPPPPPPPKKPGELPTTP